MESDNIKPRKPRRKKAANGKIKGARKAPVKIEKPKVEPVLGLTPETLARIADERREVIRHRQTIIMAATGKNYGRP